MFRALIISALTVASSMAATRPSSADDPIARKRRQAQRLREQIDATDERLSQLEEDFVEADLSLADATRRSRSATTERDEAHRRLAVQRATARRRTVGAYMRGSLSAASAEAMARGRDAIADESSAIGYRAVIERSGADALDDLRATEIEVTERDDRARIAAQQADALTRAISRRRQEAEALERRQSTLLRQAEGELGKLIEEDRARRAREEEAAARRALAAAQAKARAFLAQQRDERARAERAGREQAARAANASAASARAADAARERARRSATVEPGDARIGRDRANARAAAQQALLAAPADAVSELPASPTAGAAVSAARAQLGKPYLWGSTGPGSFDCSGLTSWAWRAAGRSLPHSSRAQFAATTRIPVSQIRPGDLVFYGRPIHHVGLYVGAGMMVEAPHRGALVRVRSIFRRDLVGVGRV